jgi:sugar lactone lactonase YvrE
MLRRRLVATCSAALVVSSAFVLIATASAAEKAGARDLYDGTPATTVQLYAPEDVTFDAGGNVYISEFGTSKTAGHRVNKVDPAGNLSVVAGTGVEGYGGDGGPATLAELDAPSGLLIDTTGALVVADHHNGCMRRVDASGVINAIVGYCGRVGYNGDGKFPALKTKFNDPIGIVEDSIGTMYVADEQNARVRRVTPDGVVSTILGGGKIPLPNAPNGTLGTSIEMSHPSYLALDPSGNLYVSDFQWNQVVRLDPHGRVTHIAGTGAAGFDGDGGPATSAVLDFPTGIALDARGRLYIDDSFNNRIRMVDTQGRISTVAGSGPFGFGTGSYSGDGGKATAATLNQPSGIALSSDGRLFIADQGNNVVRVVQPGGAIELFAGRPPSS